MRFQPQGRVRLDRSHQLAAGLIAGVIPFQRVDFVTGRQYTQGGTATPDTGSTAGRGFATNGTSGYITAPITPIVLTQWTIFAVLKGDTPATDTRAVSLANSTTTTPYIQIGTGTSDFRMVRVLAQSDAGGLPANQPSVGFGFDGPTRTIALTYDGSNVRCYIDGVLDTTATTSTGAAWTVNQFSVGAFVRTTASNFWKGSAFLSMAHKRALSGPEIKSLSANPWQIFTTPEDDDELAAAPGDGGVSASLNVTLGTLAMSATGSSALAAVQSASLGAATLTAAGGPRLAAAVAATLAPITLATSGTLKTVAALAQTLAPTALAANGTVAQPSAGPGAIQASLNATLAPATLAASSHLALSGRLIRTLDGAALAAVAACSSAANVGVTLAPATLAAGGAVASALQLAGLLDATTLSASARLFILDGLPTPPERTVRVAGEVRAYSIPADGRSSSVSSTAGHIPVAAEPRTLH